MVATDGGEMFSGDQPWGLGSVNKKIIELGSERLQKKGNQWGYVTNSGASHIGCGRGSCREREIFTQWQKP